MERLKPCPFCGSKKLELCRTNKHACWVRCNDCGSEAKSFAGRKRAIHFWNTRHREIYSAVFVDDSEKE